MGSPTTQNESAPGPELGLVARLRAVLPRLSPSMRKVADLLLENPELPLSLSITDLAERAGTSAPTVTRFCRLLGYSGYVPLRVGVAADLGRASSQSDWVSELGRTFDPDESSDTILRSLLASHVGAIQSAADLMDLGAFEQVAAAIATSPHVDLYGIAGSGTVARGVSERLYRIGVNSHAWTEVHLGLASAALLPAGAVAVAISSSGRTTEVVEMLAVARDRGATTVALTGDPLSPLAELADVHLRTSPADEYHSPGELAAQQVQLFACNVLYMFVARATFERTRDSLARTSAAIDSHRQPRRRPSA